MSRTRNSHCVGQLYLKNKVIGKEIRFVVIRDTGLGEGNWMKVVNMCKLPVIR